MHFLDSHYFNIFLSNFFSIIFFSVPELLVLNDCDIDCAGDSDDLRKKCCSVKELDLAQNKLKNWNEVFMILSHMPRVEFVNLSLNRLSGPVDLPIECGLDRLRSLVLNNTRLDWESVDTLIKRLPSLQELHLSLNDYRNVLIDTLDDEVFYETVDNDNDVFSNTNGDYQSEHENIAKPTTSTSTADNTNKNTIDFNDSNELNNGENIKRRKYYLTK